MRRTGRLKIQLLGATNLPGRRSSSETFFAIVKIDGRPCAQYKATNENWNDVFDIQVDKAQEIEIAVFDHESKMLMGMIWFNISDLEEDLIHLYGADYATKYTNLNDVKEYWLDLEPGGQLLLKLNFGTSC